MSAVNLAALVERLERWFSDCGREYPWRRTRDPYAILVSEIMLQQTQITTVIERGYYRRWMDKFPTLAVLATAPENDVLSTWEGLGYYRRARNLQALARQVVDLHGGSLPRDPTSLAALPGIGPYTVGAISSFAFDLPEPLVDGNVARVLARWFDDPTPIDSLVGHKQLWSRARDLVRLAVSPRHFNSALMELGQTICRPGQPTCQQCPVQDHCQTSNPADLPVKRPRAAPTDITERVYWRTDSDSVLLEKETGSRRTGFWKLPSLPDTLPLPPVLARSSYGITRYKVTLWVHECPSPAPPLTAAQQWIPHAEMEDLPLASPHRRALRARMSSISGELLLGPAHSSSNHF